MAIYSFSGYLSPIGTSVGNAAAMVRGRARAFFVTTMNMGPGDKRAYVIARDPVPHLAGLPGWAAVEFNWGGAPPS